MVGICYLLWVQWDGLFKGGSGVVYRGEDGKEGVKGLDGGRWRELDRRWWWC